MHSSWFRSTFLGVFKYLQIKGWGPNFCMQPILQKIWIIWSPLLYFIFKGFMDPNSWTFTRSEWILRDWGVLFSNSWNVYKLKSGGGLISGANQLCRKSALFGSAFCISILKVLLTQILLHSLDLNAFCMMEKYSFQSLEISISWRGGA